MTLKIKGWSARLGNNICQLKNASFIAFHHKHDLIIPKNNFFRNTHLLKENENNNKEIMIDKKNNFKSQFHFNLPFKVEHHLFEKNIDDVKDIMIQNFKYNYKKRQSLTNNDLVIHIRSGDLFKTDEKVHPKYISAPLYFYKKIITNNHYKNIYLVCEDTKNPVIKKLLEIYPNIIYNEKNTLKDDIKLILQAKHIVSSVGTFVQSLLWMTKYTKKVYIPSFVRKNGYPPNLKIEVIDLPGFKEKIGKWKNNKEQRKILIHYKHL